MKEERNRGERGYRDEEGRYKGRLEEKFKKYVMNKERKKGEIRKWRRKDNEKWKDRLIIDGNEDNWEGWRYGIE